MVTKKKKKCATETKYVASGMTYNYEDFVNAIIIRAADDYRNARMKENKQINKLRLYSNVDRQEIILADMRSTKREIGELEKFFMKSEWFDLLPTMDGKYILDNLRKEFK